MTRKPLRARFLIFGVFTSVGAAATEPRVSAFPDPYDPGKMRSVVTREARENLGLSPEGLDGKSPAGGLRQA